MEYPLITDSGVSKVQTICWVASNEAEVREVFKRATTFILKKDRDVKIN